MDELRKLLISKGFIQTHNDASMNRYVRKVDDSILLMASSETWMHNVDYHPLAEGYSFKTLRDYLKKLT